MGIITFIIKTTFGNTIKFIFAANFKLLLMPLLVTIYRLYISILFISSN